MELKTTYLVTRDSQRRAGIGDCIVITFDEDFHPAQDRKACIVIDGGYSETAKILRDFLHGERISEIDLMVATHVDDDHINGLRKFITNYVLLEEPEFKIHNYWGPAPKDYSSISITEFIGMALRLLELVIDEMSFVTKSVNNNEKLIEKVRSVLPAVIIHHPSYSTRDNLPQIFRNVRLDVLAPDIQIAATKIKQLHASELELAKLISVDEGIDLSDDQWEPVIKKAAIENNRTANNQSIVFKLVPLNEEGEDIKEHTFLFTGDAEHESWDKMIRRPGADLKAKYLKISHHGSETGTTNDILTQVNPDYCVICAGRNIHGLPDKPVLAMIRGGGVKFYCTGRNPKSGESPCAETSIRTQCPRWNNNAAVEILTPVEFKVDTAQNGLQITGVACGVNWV